MYVERIYRDAEMWQNEMIPKLEHVLFQVFTA